LQQRNGKKIYNTVLRGLSMRNTEAYNFWQQKLQAIQNRKTYTMNLLKEIKIGSELKLAFTEENRRNMKRSTYETTNVHRGRVIQITPSVIYVQDERGFRQGIDINSIYAGIVKAEVI
jgi:hypothetical protein